MDTFNVRKWRKKSAHGYFYCPEVEKEVNQHRILLMPGREKRGQHMDPPNAKTIYKKTFIARKWRKRSAHSASASAFLDCFH
jgi:hypothetical protein